jgi:two-component system response regulator HydG/two-component system response regulator AtoC
MPLLKQLMNEHEKTLIEKYLLENSGNRSRTAAILGISRRGLLNKIRAHRIGQADPDPTEPTEP